MDDLLSDPVSRCALHENILIHAVFSRPKDGVATLAYVAASTPFLAPSKAWMAGQSPAMTNFDLVQVERL